VTARLDPLPAALVGMLEYDRITQWMGDELAVDDALDVSRCCWSLEGFDEHGVGVVTVVANDTGRPVASAMVHWSALLR